MYAELGDRHLEAMARTHLGDTHHAAGDARAARDAWQNALAVLGEVDHPAAQKVRAKIAMLAATSAARRLDRFQSPVLTV